MAADSIGASVVTTGDHNDVTVNFFHASTVRSPEALREAYLHHVLRAAGRLSLAGVDPKSAGRESEAIALHEVYTALLTLGRRMDDEVAPATRARKKTRDRPLTAVEQLDRHPRLVLLGEPGGGKSTFLNFVAMCLAGQGLADKRVNLRALTTPVPRDDDDAEPGQKPKRQPWRHGALLPVRIVLRDLAARGLPPVGEAACAQHLWAFVVSELQAATLADFAPEIERTLREDGGLLLLDGLDEVPEADRRRVQIKQAVEDFAGSHPRCRILVTSRTYAYQKQDWNLRGFAEATLAPFGWAQRELFIDRWYAHVAAVRGMNEDDARGRAELLKRAIGGSDRLAALAERPLLLTLMASLHAWRGGSLPERREELYADAVELLLDWWESPKVVRDAAGQMVVVQPSLAEWMKVEKHRVRSFLDEIACEAHAAQPDLVGAADVPEGKLISGLMAISNNPDVRPARLIEYLSDRAGLLLPRGEGVYSFPHRTFQEYLAACHLTQRDFPDEMADRVLAEPERWREVALLAAAKAARGTPAALWYLADALCDGEPGGKEGARELWGALIAGQAIAETVDPTKLTARAKSRVERAARWLVRVMRGDELLPVERARAGDHLATLGDPRFDPEAWWLPREEALGFVEVPAGSFFMGSDPKRDRWAKSTEQPYHEVEMPAYWAGKYPVTTAQFRTFVEESGHRPSHPACLHAAANRPVAWVTWNDAMSYAAWLTERLRGSRKTPEPLRTLLQQGWRITLPSEAEWEKAARGGDGRIFPWGNKADANLANYNMTIGKTSAVGCFPDGASPYRCEEMSGNVWEWTRCNLAEYPYQSASEVHSAEGRLSFRGVVLRGGALLNDSGYIRCARRLDDPPTAASRAIGFRVVVSNISER